MAININIDGFNNSTNLVLGSENAKISNSNNNLNKYIDDIKLYIKTQLTNLLTESFISNNSISTLSSNLINNFELCWVGKPESFYNDINSSNLKNTTNKIFTHFDNNLGSKTIYLQKSDGTFISTILNFSSEIIEKINFVNKNVPNELINTPQGLHTLGILNNSIIIDGSTPKSLLNSEFFGLKKYLTLYAYRFDGYNINNTLKLNSSIKNILSSTIIVTNGVDISNNKFVTVKLENCKLNNTLISDLSYEITKDYSKIYNNVSLNNNYLYLNNPIVPTINNVFPPIDLSAINVNLIVNKLSNTMTFTITPFGDFMYNNVNNYYKDATTNGSVICNFITYSENN